MASGGSFADPEDLVRRDLTAIETLGQALTGSGKPFVSTSGTFVMAAGRARTRALLGWTPTHATLLEDMETGDYFAAQAA
jgi:hypothetical protein